MGFTSKGDVEIKVPAGNRELKQVAEKRILGVIIDQNLNFTAHIEHCASKAISQITKLNVLTSGLRGANAELLITLYKSCIRPNLEYAYPVWCSTKDISPLERVQYLALRKACGAMHGTPASAIDVITRTLPLDLRLNEVLLNGFLKISRKGNDNHLKAKVLGLLDDNIYMDHRIITPLHKFTMVR